MATFLYRLGRTAFRRRWLVVLLWAVVLGAVGAGAAKAPAAGDDGTSFMPGIEAQKAFDLIGERFPGSDADGADARIVFIAPEGQKVTAPVIAPPSTHWSRRPPASRRSPVPSVPSRPAR